MTNKAHNFAKIKHQLLEKEQRDVKSVLWKLNDEQNDYVVRILGYETKPEIYEITTKKIRAPGRWSDIIRDVNYANKRNIGKLYRRLNSAELEELERHDVLVRPFKRRVFLQS